MKYKLSVFFIICLKSKFIVASDLERYNFVQEEVHESKDTYDEIAKKWIIENKFDKLSIEKRKKILKYIDNLYKFYNETNSPVQVTVKFSSGIIENGSKSVFELNYLDTKLINAIIDNLNH